MTYAITGIKAGLGPGEQVPLRREIDEWWASKDKNDVYQRSLFVYALHAFMEMDPDEQLSYFGVAGIHGQPLIPWDTITPKAETFAQEDQEEMIHAAETFRLPYWDWAMRKPDWRRPNDLNRYGPNVPFILTVPKVEVKTKTGVSEVDNPMWKFTLPPNGNKTTFGDYGIQRYNNLPFPAAKATSKHPSTSNSRDKDFVSAWVNGDKQNVDLITGELRGSQAVDSNTLPEAVYRLFLEENFPTFNSFAADGFRPGQSPAEYSSLESIHGAIHVFTGGSGQMSSVPVAAFGTSMSPVSLIDPIFWMHHCNVDRLFALWQDLYPKKYVEPFSAERGRIDPNISLLPFHKDTVGSTWTAASCRYQQKDLYYTYPELQRWLDKYKTNGKFDEVKYQKALRTAIELKYSTTGKATLQLPQNDGLATTQLLSLNAENFQIENFPPPLVAKAQALATSKTEQQQPIVPNSSELQEKWEENDYVVNVLYDRFALGGYPYLIRIFLGDVPEGPPFYFVDTPTQVGLVYNFSGPTESRGQGPEGCANCTRQQQDHELSTGQVILTDYLIERIHKHVQERGLTLQTLSREEVVQYLKNNLHWRISDANDVLVAKENVPSLKISVAMGKATHFSEASRFSRYENYETLWEVTEGRLAGAAPGDLD
ncbi:tyrosinase [Phlyctema vagabunda]|uniref:tyrosinase n=1 Tax=Phlyctema vagabunda TaxID=108571 RepID=A0ABR4PYK1_9HELO